MEGYLKKITDNVLVEKLTLVGAVLVEGPKWCGKSTTAEEFAKTVIYMQDPEKKEQNKALAKNAPSKFLLRETPVLIDEWQIIPFIWDAIRFEIDKRKSVGQFILTGSTMPVDDSEISHTGTGRISRVTMRPMSLFESKDSNGNVSLQKLFELNNDDYSISDKVQKDIDDLTFVICRGGWPSACVKNDNDSLKLVYEYYNGLINADMTKVDNVERDPRKVDLLLKSYSINISTECSNETLKDDMSKFEDKTLSTQTITNYIKALKKIFVVE